MKYSIIPTFLFLIINFNIFAEDWNIIHTNKDDYYHFIDGIDSLNYVVSGFFSNDSIYNLKQHTFIKKTIDGGKTWTELWKGHKIIPDDPETKFVSKIKMLSKDVIIAGVKFGIILRTTDGGAIWDSTLIDSEEECTALSFADSVYGALSYLVTDYILITDNAGESWEKLYKPEIEEFGTKYNIDDIDRLSDSIFIMSHYQWTTNELYTLKTTDKGATWQISESIKEFGNDNVYFDENLGFKAGCVRSGINKTPLIMKTTDGGMHWEYNMLAGTDDGLAFNDLHLTKNGKICGTNIKYIWCSTDKGETWFHETYEPFRPSQRFRQTCYGGYNSGLLICTYYDIYSNTYKNDVEETPEVSKTFLVYPNPSRNGQINANLSLDAISDVEFELINGLGIVVYSKIYKSLSVGDNSINLNPAKKLAPGAYFLRARFGNGESMVRGIVVD